MPVHEAQKGLIFVQLDVQLGVQVSANNRMESRPQRTKMIYLARARKSNRLADYLGSFTDEKWMMRAEKGS